MTWSISPTLRICCCRMAAMRWKCWGGALMGVISKLHLLAIRLHLRRIFLLSRRAGWDFGGGVYIRFCGNGHLGFRPDGGSLSKSPEAGPVESNQSASAPPLGASPRLGMPSLRHCSVGPPRRAIHGPARLTRHPCRVAHSTMPAFGHRG